MVCGFATERPPSWHELQHAILRNFGGLDSVKPIDVFNKYLKHMGRNTKVVIDNNVKPNFENCLN